MLSSFCGWPLLNLVGFAGVVVVNALANALPLNGNATGELSDLYPNKFVPSGYVFSIWGFIYFMCAVFTLCPLFSSRALQEVTKLQIRFFASCFFNVSWLFAWHWQELWLSVCVMLCLLASLVVLYLAVDRIQWADPEATEKSRIGPWAFNVTFSVYLGWITIATVANLTAALVSSNWDGAASTEWAVVMEILVLFITLPMVLIKGDVAYGCVIIWAALGIMHKQSGEASIVATSLVVSVLVALAAIFTLGRRFHTSEDNTHYKKDGQGHRQQIA